MKNVFVSIEGMRFREASIARAVLRDSIPVQVYVASSLCWLCLTGSFLFWLVASFMKGRVRNFWVSR